MPTKLADEPLVWKVCCIAALGYVHAQPHVVGLTANEKALQDTSNQNIYLVLEHFRTEEFKQTAP
ncbi:hypothetical protein N7471_013430 [Penicillium samsonianum]|uniref:uncharacterized protein n=1 Tax=Penicillium samsonianum TaxID=1882272 RepID=UPI0025477582|nr:uncharacterized protein N7471_013430 [Penicillium samsonianum]KAJ6118810.1 hypothetical protein N7471_013430 [Penicillium samsonianum]